MQLTGLLFLSCLVAFAKAEDSNVSNIRSEPEEENTAVDRDTSQPILQPSLASPHASSTQVPGDSIQFLQWYRRNTTEGKIIKWIVIIGGYLIVCGIIKYFFLGDGTTTDGKTREEKLKQNHVNAQHCKNNKCGVNNCQSNCCQSQCTTECKCYDCCKECEFFRKNISDPNPFTVYCGVMFGVLLLGAIVYIFIWTLQYNDTTVNSQL